MKTNVHRLPVSIWSYTVIDCNENVLQSGTVKTSEHAPKQAAIDKALFKYYGRKTQFQIGIKVSVKKEKSL